MESIHAHSAHSAPANKWAERYGINVLVFWLNERYCDTRRPIDSLTKMVRTEKTPNMKSHTQIKIQKHIWMLTLYVCVSGTENTLNDITLTLSHRVNKWMGKKKKKRTQHFELGPQQQQQKQQHQRNALDVCVCVLHALKMAAVIRLQTPEFRLSGAQQQQFFTSLFCFN